MTINSTAAASGPYVATGAQQSMPFDFHAASADEIRVEVDGVEVTGFTVRLESDGTGTVEGVFATGGIVYIESAPSFLQDTDFNRFAPYFPDQINAPLDRAAIRDIVLKDKLDRAPAAPRDGSANGRFPALDAQGQWYFPDASPVGDSGLRIDLAQPSGGSLVAYIAAGAGAVLRSLLDKLRETPAITDFGAIAGDTGNQAPAIQKALDAVSASGGGALVIPAGIFRTTGTIVVPSDVELRGYGRRSALHFVNGARADAIRITGTLGDRRSNVRLRNFAVYGDAGFFGGTPSVVNGGGINAVFADDCEIDRLWVSGFSDGGIAFLNGSDNAVTNCRVRYTGQGISFNANAIDVYGNVAANNRITETGTYNGLHLEGSFGDGTGEGKVYDTTLTGNAIRDSREAGINIEIAPNTACTGNTVRRSGLGATDIDMGVKLFGAPGSSLNGNTVTASTGYGIVVGANSGQSTITGNTTQGNTEGGLLLTDSAIAGGAPIATTLDVQIAGNNFNEGDFVRSGNVSLRTDNRTRGVPFTNVGHPDTLTLDWYEEGVFTPVAGGRTTAGTGTYTDQTGRFTRIGNVVVYELTIGWSAHTGAGQLILTGLPYPPAVDVRHAATIAPNGLAVGGSLTAMIQQNQMSISLFKYDNTSGAQSEVAITGGVPALTVSGWYRAA